MVGGVESGEGRLELCEGRVWGTVCNEGWDLNAARVACSELIPNVDPAGKKTSILTATAIIVSIFAF